MTTSLADPLAAVRYAASIAAQCERLGLSIRTSNDFEEFAKVRLEARGERVSPMFDASVGLLDQPRAFWVGGQTADGRISALQAFRLDRVDTNLADWAMSWMVSLYLRRGELVVPARLHPPENSRTSQIAGRVVYHGEMWIDRINKSREIFDNFLRLGILLAHLKWQPDALWALISNPIARHGYIARSGYAHQEKGFFQWTLEPRGADPVEWVVLAERDHIEYLISAGELIRS